MEALFTILGLLGISGIVGTIVSRYVRPKATPLELLQEVQEERLEDRKRIEKLEGHDRDRQKDMRVLTDYVHTLRQHIVDGQPPPPPAWPEGLNR